MMSDDKNTNQITVNLATDTGPVKHGASGFLYGLGKNEVPSANMLAPLCPQVAAQKPEGGAQHPNGDALNVSDTFKAAGGKEIEIYLQDVYPAWPYDNLGLEDYLSKVDPIIRQVLDHPNRKLFSYVPFNEPDQIWYNKEDKMQAFLGDWAVVYQRIKSIDPEARLVGPNFARYDSPSYRDFLAYTKEHGCLPDAISWHELNDDFFSGWYTRYGDFRRIERSLGLPAREICINEYSRISGDLGIPGKLIQWITRLETSKVDGCLAYWTDAGSLNNLVARDNYNKATGAWWLYRWYGGMTGHTVVVIPPEVNAQGLQGLAALDPERKQVRFLFGGASGPVKVMVTGLDSLPYFGERVHVVVWAVDSTGTASSDGPTVVLENNVTSANGQIHILTSQLNETSAYQLVITPTQELRGGWRANRYGASEAAVSGGGARTTFVVTAPDNGFYQVRLRYSAGPIKGLAGGRSVRLALNGENLQDISLPATMGWEQWADKAAHIFLTAGINRITTEAASDGRSAVTFDSIEITPIKGQVSVFEVGATNPRLSGTARLVEDPATPGGSYVTGIGGGPGNVLEFNPINVPNSRSYRMVVHFSNAEFRGGHSYNSQVVDRYAEIRVNGGEPQGAYFRNTFASTNYQTRVIDVDLQAGDNVISFSNSTAGAYAPDIAGIEIASKILV